MREVVVGSALARMLHVPGLFDCASLYRRPRCAPLISLPYLQALALIDDRLGGEQHSIYAYGLVLDDLLDQPDLDRVVGPAR